MFGFRSHDSPQIYSSFQWQAREIEIEIVLSNVFTPTRKTLDF